MSLLLGQLLDSCAACYFAEDAKLLFQSAELHNPSSEQNVQSIKRQSCLWKSRLQLSESLLAAEYGMRGNIPSNVTQINYVFGDLFLVIKQHSQSQNKNAVSNTPPEVIQAPLLARYKRAYQVKLSIRNAACNSLAAFCSAAPHTNLGNVIPVVSNVNYSISNPTIKSWKGSGHGHQVILDVLTSNLSMYKQLLHYHYCIPNGTDRKEIEILGAGIKLYSCHDMCKLCCQAWSVCLPEIQDRLLKMFTHSGYKMQNKMSMPFFVISYANRPYIGSDHISVYDATSYCLVSGPAPIRKPTVAKHGVKSESPSAPPSKPQGMSGSPNITNTNNAKGTPDRSGLSKVKPRPQHSSSGWKVTKRIETQADQPKALSLRLQGPLPVKKVLKPLEMVAWVEKAAEQHSAAEAGDVNDTQVSPHTKSPRKSKSHNKRTKSAPHYRPDERPLDIARWLFGKHGLISQKLIEKQELTEDPGSLSPDAVIRESKTSTAHAVRGSFKPAVDVKQSASGLLFKGASKSDPPRAISEGRGPRQSVEVDRYNSPIPGKGNTIKDSLATLIPAVDSPKADCIVTTAQWHSESCLVGAAPTYLRGLRYSLVPADMTKLQGGTAALHASQLSGEIDMSQPPYGAAHEKLPRIYSHIAFCSHSEEERVKIPIRMRGTGVMVSPYRAGMSQMSETLGSYL